jgi:hypothetical protein
MALSPSGAPGSPFLTVFRGNLLGPLSGPPVWDWCNDATKIFMQVGRYTSVFAVGRVFLRKLPTASHSTCVACPGETWEKRSTATRVAEFREELVLLARCLRTL